jgi:hypothetical protein
MGAVTIANCLSEAQSNLWSLIRTNATVLTITKNVLDGVPVGLTSGTGFPYVIVPTPNIESGEWVTLTKKKETISFKVEVFDRKESVLRSLCDAIRNVAETNTTLFANSYGMYRYMNSSGNLSYVMMDDNSVVYNYTLTLEYEWWDC